MSSLLGGSVAPAYPFAEVGAGFDACPIVEARDVQQHDHDSKLPLFWPADGSPSRRPTTDATDPRTGEALRPVLQLRVVVETGVIDPTIEYDDGRRSVYLRAQSLQALRADLRRTGSRDLLPGGLLSMRLIEEEKVDPATGKRRGIAKKIYSVRYEPPAVGEEPGVAARDEHQGRLKDAVAARMASDEPPF